MSARSSLENTKRRMNRLTHYEWMLTSSQYLSSRALGWTILLSLLS